MAYIGNSPANVGNYQIVDDISGSFNGSLVTFALTTSSSSISPAKSGQLLVGINGVMQEPDDTGTNGFKVSGSNIIFSSAPAASSTFWAVYQGQNVDIGTPSAGTVTATELATNAVTNAKVADDAIGVAELSATGTANNSVYLRGDNSWSVVDGLPTQTSHSGKYLTTDGSDSSWATLNTNTTTKGMYEHAITISSDYTITTNNNAMTAGPFTIGTGVTVTTPSGSTWVIV
jgi:hypothetical protein